ncbi:hypothetical protein KDL45_07880, partial [bacterium]|nr:hypothetical protein [bacterium]
MSNQPLTNEQKITYGVIGAMVFVALMAFLFSRSCNVGQPQRGLDVFAGGPLSSLSTSAKRIAALEDAALAGPQRALSPKFAFEPKLSFDGAKDFNTTWEEFDLFGMPSLVPKRPDELRQALLNSVNSDADLDADKARLFLDATLRTEGPDASVKAADDLAKSHADDAAVLATCAGFLEERLHPADAAATHRRRFDALLKDLATTSDKTRRQHIAADAGSALAEVERIAKAYRLAESTDADHVRLLDAAPDQPELLWAYLDRLVADDARDRALKEIERRHGAFTGDTARLAIFEAKLLEDEERIDEAISRLDTNPELFSKPVIFDALTQTLRRHYRIDEWRNALRERLAAKLDLDALERLLADASRSGAYGYDELAMPTESAEPGSVAALLATAEDLARRDGISPEQLAKLADLVQTHGGARFADKAAPYRLNLYALATTDAERNERALDLAEALTSVAGTMPVPGDASMARTIGREFLDQDPGIAGGLLSLDWNWRGTGNVFARVHPASRRYENLRQALSLALPLAASDDEPTAARATALADDVYARLRLLEKREELLERFLDRHRASKSSPEFLWSLAAIARERKNVDAELARLEDLTDWATKYDDPTWAAKARREIIARLIAEKRFDRVLPQYEAMIRARPDDEALLSEFIQFCERHHLFEETVGAYERAIDRFDSMRYQDRLARFLLRQSRRDAFEDLTANLARTVGRRELEDYLDRHVAYGKWGSAESAFFDRVYQIALARFPESDRALRQLLDFYGRYAREQEQARERRTALLLRYFATRDDLADDLVAALASQNKLFAAIDDLASRTSLNPAQARFLAHAFGFASAYEQQYRAVEILEAAYQERSLGESLAGLERSLDRSFHADAPSMSQDAAKHYTALATAYPANGAYPTLAGEVDLESGRASAASASWESILKIRPGLADPYLELATLYWDYFMFDHALGVIQQGRNALADPNLLAKEAAYLFENKNNVDRAIQEYVRVICASEYIDWEVQERLRTLAEKDGKVGKKIDDAFDTYLKRDGATSPEVTRYGQMLENTGRRSRKTQVYRAAMARFDNPDFLNEAAAYFLRVDEPDAASLALEKRAEVSGRDAASLLRLMAHYEQIDESDHADSVARELLKTHPVGSQRHFEILQRVAQTRWRLGRKAQALDDFQSLAQLLPTGRRRDEALFDFARRAMDAGEQQAAVTTLTTLASENPDRPEYVAALADHFAKEKMRDELTALYKDALSRVRSVSLPSGTKANLIAQYRDDLIDAYLTQNRPREALDEAIEKLNAAAPDEGVVDEVYRLAERHELRDRLVAYYEKLADKANKNYRWGAVLGDLYRRLGRTEDAAKRYRQAVANAPSRLELYDRLIKAQQALDDDAGLAKTLRRRYELSGSAYDLRRYAEAATKAGQGDEARAMLAKTVADKGTPAWRLAMVAGAFWKGGDRETARD